MSVVSEQSRHRVSYKCFGIYEYLLISMNFSNFISYRAKILGFILQNNRIVLGKKQKTLLQILKRVKNI